MTKCLGSFRSDRWRFVFFYTNNFYFNNFVLASCPFLFLLIIYYLCLMFTISTCSMYVFLSAQVAQWQSTSAQLGDCSFWPITDVDNSGLCWLVNFACTMRVDNDQWWWDQCVILCAQYISLCNLLDAGENRQYDVRNNVHCTLLGYRGNSPSSETEALASYDVRSINSIIYLKMHQMSF